jgi:biotin operon repressor
LSFNTVSSALDALKSLGIAVEMTPRRGRLLCYLPYLTLLDEGTVVP